MYLLALETAFGKFSIALFSDGKLVDDFVCEKENEQAELLIPSIEEILARNKIKYTDLSFIAAGIGPGSFTGVRIGMAAAKGLALATGAKLIGVSSLEAAFYRQGGGDVYLNAQRGQAYFLPASGEAALVDYGGEYSLLPDAKDVGYVALNKQPGEFKPLYIRKPDAKFRLREIAEKDIPWLVEMHGKCFTNKWNAAMFAGAKGIIADRLGFLVYEIIGDEGEIKTIAVLPEARRNGVASYMWQELMKNCSIKKVSKVFLEVEAGNISALEFYKKLGFKVISERKDYYGPGRNALNMSRHCE